MTILQSNIMPLDSTGKFKTELPPKNRNKIHVAMDNFEVETTDIDSGDIIELMQISTGAIINKIWILNDDLDSGSPTLTFDLGFYDRDGVAVDVDILVDGSTELQSANTVETLIYEAATDKVGDQVFEVAVPGTTVDPVQDYTLAITIDNVAATAVAGTLAFKVEWASIN